MKNSKQTRRTPQDNPVDLIASLAQVLPLLDSEKCLQALLAEYHPKGPQCPACGHALTSEQEQSWRGGSRVFCRQCKKKFFPWHGTPLQGLHIKPEEAVLFRLAVLVGLRKKDIGQLFSRQPHAISSWLARLCATNLPEEKK
jgi:transposase-like protein